MTSAKRNRTTTRTTTTCTVTGCTRKRRKGGALCLAHVRIADATGLTPAQLHPIPRRPQGMPLDRRFDTYAVLNADGCHVWIGARTDRGYGAIWTQDADAPWIYAHRYAWIRENGPIPQGMVIDHRCRVRACVNPDHLDVVTHGENLRRGVLARRLEAQGVEWTPELLEHAPQPPYARS